MGRFLILFMVLFTGYGFSFTLKFDNLPDNTLITNQYASSNVTFSGDIYISNSGTGNFRNNESGDNVAYLSNGTGGYTNATINIINNSTVSKGISFYYSYGGTGDGLVEIWSGQNGQGARLGEIKLKDDDFFRSQNADGEYRLWKYASTSFDTQAKSITFNGQNKRIAFDNIVIDEVPSQKRFGMKLSLLDIPYSLTDSASIGIHHAPDARKSNTFRIALAVDSPNANNICSDYTFIIEEGSTVVAQQQSMRCTFTASSGNIPNHIKIDFIINSRGTNARNIDKYYFENAKVIMEHNANGTKQTLDFIKQFTVLGTGFDIKKDGFSFQNGDWQTVTHTNVFPEDIYEAAKTILSYYDDGDLDLYLFARNTLWNNIGFIPKKSNIIFNMSKNVKDERDGDIEYFRGSPGGLCNGFANINVANFNYRNATWGVGGNLTTEWKRHITNHWNTTISKSKTPFRALKNDPYSYQPSDIEVFKKLLYYQVIQNAYAKTPNSSWIGQYKKSHPFGDAVKRNELKNILKQGSPFTVSIAWNGSKGISHHAISATHFISYNNIDKWYFADSNSIDKFTRFIITKNSSSIYQQYNYSYHGDTLTAVVGNIKNDVAFLYNKSNSTATSSRPKLIRTHKKLKKKNLASKVIFSETITFPKHIHLRFIGGNIKSIKDTSNKNNVISVPYMNKYDPSIVYQQNVSLFGNQLLLPHNKTYDITIEKDKSFSFLKILVTLPDKKGNVELLHYDNIAIDKKDFTLATLTVGVDNKKNVVLREDGVEILPTDKNIYSLRINSATNANAIVKLGTIRLTWENPDNPNFKEVIIVRKENNASTSANDGEEVYRGSGERFADANTEADKSYVYSLYAHDLNGEYAEAERLYVDSTGYTLYGTVLDGAGTAVSDARVELKSQSGRFINLANTDKSGRYSFNSMNPGDYSLSFSHNNYSFVKSELNTSIEDKSLQVDNTAEGKATLSIGASQRLHEGEQTSIAWGGLHIEDGAKVDIVLDKNGTTKSIATGISYSKHNYDWTVESLEKGTTQLATLKVVLSDEPSVSAQKDVVILARGKEAYDFNDDGKVDDADIKAVVDRWQSQIGDKTYKALYDANKDGRIDIKDIMLVVHKKETL